MRTHVCRECRHQLQCLSKQYIVRANKDAYPGQLSRQVSREGKRNEITERQPVFYVVSSLNLVQASTPSSGRKVETPHKHMSASGITLLQALRHSGTQASVPPHSLLSLAALAPQHLYNEGQGFWIREARPPDVLLTPPHLVLFVERPSILILISSQDFNQETLAFPDWQLLRKTSPLWRRQAFAASFTTASSFIIVKLYMDKVTRKPLPPCIADPTVIGPRPVWSCNLFTIAGPR